MAKDHITPIKRLVANGENEKILPAVNKSLAEIQEEIAALRQQEALLKALLVFHAPSQAVEAPPKKVPTVSASITDDGLTSQDRSRYVRNAAIELAQGGQSELTAGDVIDALANKGIIFSIKRPASMVGTVLSGMPQFSRIAQNRFRFLGYSVEQPRRDAKILTSNAPGATMTAGGNNERGEEGGNEADD